MLRMLMLLGTQLCVLHSSTAVRTGLSDLISKGHVFEADN